MSSMSLLPCKDILFYYLMNLYPSLQTCFQKIMLVTCVNENIWFQQDSAPPYFALPARDFLNRRFPRRWIGRWGTIEPPPRYPDLTLALCLWVYLKLKFYINRTQDLKNRIRMKISKITPEIIHNIQKECRRRLNYSQKAGA